MKNNVENGMLPYLLGDDVAAFTTDRTVGRDEDRIIQLVGDMHGVAPEVLRFARPHQTHGDRIMPVAEEFFTLPAATRRMLMEGVDAVVTDMRHTIIGVSTADCIPVLVYDPEHHAVAAIHAGWRGTVQRIVLKTLMQMAQMYHTSPARCKAAIGPGISLDSFEVGDEVYAAFTEGQFPMDTVARRYPTVVKDGEPPQQPEKWHIDLKEINRQLLMSAGMKEENITVSEVDTFTDARFFSARREQQGAVKCGRIFSGIAVF